MASRRHFAERPRRITGRQGPEGNVRAAAAWVLDRTLESAAPVEGFLRSALVSFDERDQALLRELALGTLRWLRRLDHILGVAANRPFTGIEGALRGPLRIGAYQLLFLDRVPPYAAVDQAVEQAMQRTHRGGASFVNGVLRRIARERDLAAWTVVEDDPVRRLAIEHSHPDFLVARWLERFGQLRTEALLIANNQPKAMQVLAFRDRGGREMLAERLIDEGLEVEPARLSPLAVTVRQGNALTSRAFADGDLYVQDEGSQIAALLPPPRPGERILDAAAAPGGKTFSLVAAEPALRPVLADVSLGRLGTVRENLGRLRRRLPVLVADARRPPFVDSFDRVVVDLPCSGTGTLRKNPELKWRLSDREIGRLAEQAGAMLKSAARLVRPGGLLVAITCSLEAEENEAVGERFLREHPSYLPAALGDGLDPRVASSIEAPGRWRLFPGGDHDGFTVQVFERTGS